MNNRINETIELMRNTNFDDDKQKAEWKDLLKTIPDLLIEAEDSGDIETCDTEKLQTAIRLCRKVPDVSDRWEDVLKTIKENIKEKKHIGEWVRGLAPNKIPEMDIKEIIDDLWIREINQFVFPALEEEADRGPYRKLMDWYIAVLDRTERGERQDRIFNRLAFFYMYSTPYGTWDRENSERAKAYLLAMERRGILPVNPYGGYFGECEHTKLMDAVLNDTYEENKISIRGEYAEGLLDRVREKGLAEDIDLDNTYTDIVEMGFMDTDWDDLRNIIFTIYEKVAVNRRKGGKFSQDDLDAADRFPEEVLRDSGILPEKLQRQRKLQKSWYRNDSDAALWRQLAPKTHRAHNEGR